MIPIPSAFSPSYAKARVKFLEGAATLGARIESFNHPLPGRDGDHERSKSSNGLCWGGTQFRR